MVFERSFLSLRYSLCLLGVLLAFVRAISLLHFERGAGGIDFGVSNA